MSKWPVPVAFVIAAVVLALAGHHALPAMCLVAAVLTS